MKSSELLTKCTLCPRMCRINRFENKGYCNESTEIKVARASLHYWEEPCISGINGSGTVFFSGCNLKCCFCQNYEISAENKGAVISVDELAGIFLKLQDENAHNINLVNPTHFVPQILDALDLTKGKLHIPIVYNSGGYENTETLNLLDGYVDIFLPDLKYFNSDLSLKYSNAEDYFEYSSKAIRKMVDLVGNPRIENGIMSKGVIVRHLILPSSRKDSINLMNWLGNNFEKNEILVSLMSQYTPTYHSNKYSEINRKTSTFEYNSVIDALQKFDFEGFVQEKSSASQSYIPEFFSSKSSIL